MLGAHAVGLLGVRRRLTVVASVAGRGLWGALCVIPFTGAPADVRFALFLAAVFAGNAMTYAAGRAFDAFEAAGRTGPGLAWIFGAAVLFVALAGVVLDRHREPPLARERPRRIAETLGRPVADRPFRRLLVFLVLWSVATGLAAPFFAARMITNLHVSLSRMALFSIVSGALNLVMLPFWGFVIDRFGNRPVLSLNMIGIGFLASAPEKDRTAYLGAQNVAVGVSAFGASILGGVVAAALAGLLVKVGPFTFLNFHLLFAVSALLRLALVPVALGLREERAGSMAAVLDFVGDEISQRFAKGL